MRNTTAVIHGPVGGFRIASKECGTILPTATPTGTTDWHSAWHFLFSFFPHWIGEPYTKCWENGFFEVDGWTVVLWMEVGSIKVLDVVFHSSVHSFPLQGSNGDLTNSRS
jgi:hypothetical protein